MSRIKYAIRGPSNREKLQRYVVDGKTGCWNWIGSKNQLGYGIVVLAGLSKNIAAHRLSLALYKGFDPNSDLNVLHRCDNPSCINPDHLFVGDAFDNMADMMEKGRRGYPTGVAHHGAVLSALDIAEMKLLRLRGLTFSRIAMHFGVAKSTVRKAILGITYSETE